MIPNIDKNLKIEDTGKLTWEEQYLPYDPAVFYQGKKVTNEEFNRLFVGNIAQGNYLTKTLKRLTEDLDVVVSRKIETLYDLKPSFLKTFVSNDWGTKSDDDYYYITIPAETHGYAVETGLDIDVEMYILDSDNNYYEVSQVTVDTNNTVTLYTDVPVVGLAVIRTNSRAIEYAANTIDVKNIVGLATVARTGDYNALIGRPDARITTLEQFKQNIENGTTSVPNAKQAEKTVKAVSAALLTNIDGVEPLINGHRLSEIFEDDGITVKKATMTTTTVDHVKQADYAINATNAVNAEEAKFAERAADAINAENATNADYAQHATNADYAIRANLAEQANTATYADIANTAGNADNVTATLNNKALSDIFEEDGVTVKYATIAETAAVADKLSTESALMVVAKKASAHVGQIVEYAVSDDYTLQFYIVVRDTTTDNTRAIVYTFTNFLLLEDASTTSANYISETQNITNGIAIRIQGGITYAPNTKARFKVQWNAYNSGWADIPNNSGIYSFEEALPKHVLQFYSVATKISIEGV